jgi:hypothetical protein
MQKAIWLELAGAYGTTLWLFFTQRTQRRKGRKGEERVYVCGIIVFLSRFILFTIIWLTITFPLFTSSLFSLRPLRLCVMNWE